MEIARRHDTIPSTLAPATTAATSGPSSHFRGVSLLRRTGRWHAQINFDGRQVHLGFFLGETEAAAAYDRAAIIKWGAAHDGADLHNNHHNNNNHSAPQLNLGLNNYSQQEVAALGKLTPAGLLAALGDERNRRTVMMALAHGFTTPTAASTSKIASSLSSSLTTSSEEENKRETNKEEENDDDDAPPPLPAQLLSINSTKRPWTLLMEEAGSSAPVTPMGRQKRRKAVPSHGPSM